jgi:hypothetical protein
MREIDRYWLKDKSVPFAILLNMLQKYYHPEVDDFEELVDRARQFDADDGEMATFKEELVKLLEGNREGLHPQALGHAAGYDQRNDDEFLVWLWHELYPAEPLPEPA